MLCLFVTERAGYFHPIRINRASVLKLLKDLFCGSHFSQRIHAALGQMVLALLLTLSLSLAGQVTTNGGSGLSPSYATLQAAVTALNAATISSPVVITLSANETAPAGGYSITAQGTAANTIVIDGNAKTVTAGLQAAGSYSDAIIKLVGADYVTIKNFVLIENPANTATAPGTNTMTEWAIGLFYATTTNGAKNNFIQNNTISLNRSYQNSVAVYSNVRHTATLATLIADITLSTGSNSSNRVYSNTISNVAIGVVFVGSNTTAAMDVGNEIGGSGNQGNTITNWGNNSPHSGFAGLATTVGCIICNHQLNPTIAYNTITSASISMTTNAYRGIYNYYQIKPALTTANTINIVGNTISMQNAGSPSAYEVISIMDLTGSTYTNTQINIQGNTIQNCTSAGEWYGLYFSSIPVSATINDNTITNCNLSGIVHGMYLALGGTGVTMSNNTISNLSTSGNSQLVGLELVNATCIVKDNKITDLSVSSTGGNIVGILVNSIATNTYSILNNRIGNLLAPVCTISPGIIGIRFSNASANATFKVSYNSVYLNASSTGANFGTVCVYHTSNATSTTGKLELRNNILVNTSTPGVGANSIVLQRTSSNLGNYATTSNNNDLFAGTPGPSRLLYYDGTNAYQTLAALAPLAPRETASISLNPSFQNTTGSSASFLKIIAASAGALESGAVNIAGITDDFEGDIRQGNPGYIGTGTAPDIGADEFDLQVPIPQTLTPDPVCQGSTPTFTSAPGANYLEFFKNSKSQGFPSSTATYTPSTALAAGDVVCVRSYADPLFTFDGNLNETDWGTALATSAGGPPSGFTPTLNSLDALYLNAGSGFLSGGVAGQLENDGKNKILLFIDCRSDGYNSLNSWTNRSHSPNNSVMHLGNITFDPGFTPEYVLSINRNLGNAYYDLYSMPGDSVLFNKNTLSGPFGFAISSGTLDYTHGFEFSIPRSLLGFPTGNIRVFVMLVDEGVTTTYLSNQFLTHAGNLEGNYGAGTVDFGAATPNPISYALAADVFASDCVTTLANPTATATNSGALCESGTITLTGGAGGYGSYNWVGPNGYSAATQNASITGATPASNGPYTITATQSTCTGTARTYVVVNSRPAQPGLNPGTACVGQSPEFTASGGLVYQFLLNGTEVQAPSTDNTWQTAAPLATGDNVCVNSIVPFVFDGSCEALWGSPLATSAGGPAASSFGAGNNLDAIYLQTNPYYLFGFCAGNLVNGSNNRLFLFIDSKTGGYNDLSAWTVRNNTPYVSMQYLSSSIVFDPGFQPDYILGINQASGTIIYDLYDMAGNVNTYLNLLPAFISGFQANAGTGDYSKGFEFAIPTSLFGGLSGNISVFAAVVNDPGLGTYIPTTFSNQFLTHAETGSGNYGNGAIQFGQALPDPISIPVLSTACYGQKCIAASPLHTFQLASAAGTDNQTVCVNSSIVPITYQFGGGASGVTLSAGALPAGVTASVVGMVLTLSGTPTASGTFNFSYTTTGNSCSPLTKSITINVSNASIGGTVNSNATVCSGSNSGTLTLSGNTGSVIQWEFSTDGGANWQVVANTGTSLTYTNLTLTTQYRVKIQNAPCAAVNSGQATITMGGPLVAGSHNTAAITECIGYNPAALTLSGTSGGVAPYTYQWMINGVAVSGQTNSTYDPPAIMTAGTYNYNCQVTDFCGTVTSSAAKQITILDDPQVSISGLSAVCENTPVTFNTTITGGTGTCNYIWYQGNSASGPWTVVGGNSPTYAPPVTPSGTHYYYVQIQPLVGSCNNANSAVFQFDVHAPPATSAIWHR